MVAKELAARGLDVLLLEAGAALRAAPSASGRTSRTRRTIRPLASSASAPATVRSRPGHATCRRTASSGRPQVSAVRRVHYFANSPRAMPGAFSDYAGPNADAYDRDHVAPFGYRELIPYYEWVEHTLPVQTAAMGTKEERFLARAAKLGLPHCRRRRTSPRAVVPAAGERDPAAAGNGRQDERSRSSSRFPQANGCTFCGHCPQGCFEPVSRRATCGRSAPRTPATSRWRSPRTGGRAGRLSRCSPDAFAVRIETSGRRECDGHHRGATLSTGQTDDRGGESRRACRRAARDAAAVAEHRPAQSQRSGRPRADRSLPRLLVGRFTSYTGSTKGRRRRRDSDFPGFGGLEQAGVSPGLQGQALTSSDSGIAASTTTALRSAPAERMPSAASWASG